MAVKKTDTEEILTQDIDPQGMVKVKLPKLRGAKADQRVFAAVNGKKFMIQRGETVEVPYYIYKVLRNSERQDEIAAEKIEKLASEE